MDDFLKFNRQEILKDSGKISHDSAMKKAEQEYEKFRIKQDKNNISNFDIAIKKYLNDENKW